METKKETKESNLGLIFLLIGGVVLLAVTPFNFSDLGERTFGCSHVLAGTTSLIVGIFSLATAILVIKKRKKKR